MLDLVQTIAILDLQKQRYNCCNNDKNNTHISIFEYSSLFLILSVAIPFIFAAGIIYLFYYLISSAYKELENDKSEYMDNKTFFKFLIPITIIASIIIISIVNLLH